MEKSYRKYASKASPINNPKQPFHARNSFQNGIFENGL